MLNRATEQASAMALRVSDNALGSIKEKPVKALLITAATGAALMALVSLMIRSRDRA